MYVHTHALFEPTCACGTMRCTPVVTRAHREEASPRSMPPQRCFFL